MVDQGRYFSIFAPRQSGKTTCFEDFCEKLEKDPMYIAIILGFEAYKSLDKSEFYRDVQEDLYSRLIRRLDVVGCPNLDAVKDFLDSYQLKDHISFRIFFNKLHQIIDAKKIVIIIDEFDGIPISELENFLTILRKLYHQCKKQ